MGAVYSVELQFTSKDVDKTIKAINEYIDKASEYAIFSLEGRDRQNLEDLVKVIITDRDYYHDGDFYMTGFNASYGWEGIMMEAFEAMAPTLIDGSRMLIDVWDVDDYDELVVENGVAVQKH